MPETICTIEGFD
uniref:Uncharacterized protein n=1 Tax=Rhizophora mucronata TaxID=61149 RepID=A0A2P2J4V1_RHIMU